MNSGRRVRLAEAHGGAGGSVDPPVSSVRRPGCQLLLVDDEPQITRALHDYFTTLGYVVEIAHSEDEAHERLGDNGFAAVVSDLRLSGSSRLAGLDVIQDCRKRNPRAACIVLTAYGDPENESEAVRRGADVFLQKPAPLDLLAEQLARLLDRGNQNS